MLKTKTGLPKYTCWHNDRLGGRRVRFRKSGFSTYLTGTPWSEDFMRQYAAALDGLKAQASNIGAGLRTAPGSFNELVVSYYRSPDFLGLRASTQRVRRNIIEKFRTTDERGSRPLKALGREHIKHILGALSATPEAANNLLKALRILLAYAVDQKLIAANPAAGIKKYRSKGDGHHSWAEAEVAKYEARHLVDSRARLAMALGLYTAQRKGDVIRMGWQHIVGDCITVRQQKTGTVLTLPLHPELKAILASVPRTNLTFLMTEKGAPFSAAGFGNWFRDRCNEAGLKHCSFHGLRKAAATRLANAGCSTDMVKAMTGHKSLAEVARYTRDADQHRLARQALSIQLQDEQRTELSNLQTRLDKNAK